MNLKSGKASGPDNIINEFIIHGKHTLCGPISKLFNIILKSHCKPKSWSEGHVTSLFKSGDPANPDNYRGITILSCLGKLLTATLKNRLYEYLSEENLLNKWQAGFRPGYRTSDHSFVLKTLVNKYLHLHKQKLYVCFVDFRKAFDLVWHEGLFLKLLELGIGGNMYKLIKDMYTNCCIRIKSSEGLSHLIKSENGVRQGDGLSPLIFSSFINDLPLEFVTPKCKAPKLNEEVVPCLLYADDLILLSETAEGLQTCLDRLYNYCMTWQLQLNTSKTRIIIMKKGGGGASKQNQIPF